MTPRRAAPTMSELLLAGAMNAVFYSTPEPTFVMDLDGGFIECNDALVERLGIPRAELLAMNFAPTVAGKDAELVRGNFERAAGGTIVKYEAAGVRSDGSTFTASVINLPLRIDDEVVAVLGIARDIDELDVTRRDRDQLAERLETTLNSITDALYFLDTAWNFTYVNPRAVELAQLAQHELLGSSMWDLFPDMHGSEFGIGYKRAVAENVRVVTREHYAPFGRTLEATAYPSADGLAIYVRDVTEEEQSRARLVAQEAQLRAQADLLDTARDAIVVRDLNQTITYWNRSATDLYGWSPEEAIGSSARELLYGSWDEFDLAMESVKSNGIWSGDILQIDRDGRTIIANCRWSLVYDEHGAPSAILTVNTDVTERRRQEAVALRAQRMESLGTLAGGIAHDLNNVLTPLLMSVQMLAARESDESKLATLAIIESSAKRGADMLRQVLTFARGVEGRRISVDTRRLLQETDSFCTETLPKSITVHTTGQSGVWNTVGDPTQLTQVLLNLVSNSRDAMPTGGDLSLSARNMEVSEPYRLRLPSAGRYVLFEVEDTGTGMAREVIEKAFDPFFSTKGVGEGTGLGLATSVAIVRSHGGNIQLYSEVGVGTRFEVYLPASYETPENSRAAAVAPPAGAPQGDGEVILVVDDETAIRHSTREMLEHSGYSVVVAGNGREALDYLEAMPGRVRLVFTDLTMPVMNGTDLLARINSANPELPVLMSSGLTGIMPPSPAGSAGRAFIPKPYTTNDLLWALARLLGKVT